MYENVQDVYYDVKELDKHPWLLPYSSGTTCLPKGCMLSHANLVVNLLQFDAVEKSVFPQDQKLISPLTFFHIYGMLASFLYCGWRGQELITMSDRFDLERFCELVQEHRPARAHLVPPVSYDVLCIDIRLHMVSITEDYHLKLHVDHCGISQTPSG